MSPDLRRAVLIAEDDAFFQHEGVDFTQLRMSLQADWARGSFSRGASTITQQLAKNLYLSPSKNPLRKFREFVIARRLEAELSKDRILELYLNVIEWGDGIYGIEAASQRLLSPAGGVARAGGIGAARRRHRQPAAAEPGAPDAAAAAAPEADPAAHAQRCAGGNAEAGRAEAAGAEARRRRETGRPDKLDDEKLDEEELDAPEPEER